VITIENADTLFNATKARLNRLMADSGYSIRENQSQYALCDRNDNEIVRSKKLSNLHPFVGSIVEERALMIAAGKEIDIRGIIKPLRKVTVTNQKAEDEPRTYHILAVVEWDRVVVKHWSANAFTYEVIPMKCFVDLYIAGRLS
jgi:hypothetical protein